MDDGWAEEPSARSWNALTVALAVALVAAVGFGAWTWSQRTPPISAEIEQAILGVGCYDDSYDDTAQVVVREPDGTEVAFADLAVVEDADTYCLRSGVVEIDSDADYFLVGSRSERRSPLRVNRADIDGLKLSIGDCGLDTDCLGWDLARAVDDGGA